MPTFTTPKMRRTVNVAMAVMVFTASAILFSTPLRVQGNLLGYAQDDFYYYLVVARNLARGLGSTFDGVTPTNGYHPLYLLLLWGISLLAKSLRGVFWWLAVLDTLSATAIFLAARALFARVLRRVWLENALALIILTRCRITLCEQMEVTLALPLAILFFVLLDRSPETVSTRQWAGIGLLASLLVLARLDAILLVGLCGGFALIVPRYRAGLTIAKVAAFLAGLMPLLVAYVVLNKVVFHRLMPISGAAKQLETGHSFAWHALKLSLTPDMTQMFFFAALGLVLFPAFWGRLAPAQRVVYLAGLSFPFVHWSLNLWLSDWQLWPWYSYSIRISLVVVLAMAGTACLRYSEQRWWQTAELILFAAAVFLLVSKPYSVGGFMMDTANAATRISEFTAAHPGRYAMGDRAGMAGYLSSQPILQTEGLMMDGAYLAHIRRQDPLEDVLKIYGVDYYIAFEEKNGDGGHMGANGCYQAKEPAQAGSHSPVMRGVFCQPSEMEISAPSGQTRIFDLRQP
ncbi:glycosyltransferase family protein [Granulicella aggregans]|uniref:hypothetical protein n=1 Tax=Granulicella aggregans TaxID=474949 RepID=UPI0021E00BCA|nr:hypothetical protein [Granulicella aggregans]